MPLLVGVLVGGDKGVVAWCKIGNEADGGSEKGGCLVTDGMLSCATTTHFKLIVYTAEASHSRTVEQKSIASTAVLFQMERYISRSVSFSFSVCSDKNRSEKNTPAWISFEEGQKRRLSSEMIQSYWDLKWMSSNMPLCYRFYSMA